MTFQSLDSPETPLTVAGSTDVKRVLNFYKTLNPIDFACDNGDRIFCYPTVRDKVIKFICFRLEGQLCVLQNTN